jgi:hypothetical protein
MAVNNPLVRQPTPVLKTDTAYLNDNVIYVEIAGTSNVVVDLAAWANEVIVTDVTALFAGTEPSLVAAVVSIQPGIVPSGYAPAPTLVAGTPLQKAHRMVAARGSITIQRDKITELNVYNPNGTAVFIQLICGG